MHCAQTNSLRKDLSFTDGKIVLLLVQGLDFQLFFIFFFRGHRYTPSCETLRVRGAFEKPLIAHFQYVFLSCLTQRLIFHSWENCPLAFKIWTFSYFFIFFFRGHRYTPSCETLRVRGVFKKTLYCSLSICFLVGSFIKHIFHSFPNSIQN